MLIALRQLEEASDEDDGAPANLKALMGAFIAISGTDPPLQIEERRE